MHPLERPQLGQPYTRQGGSHQVYAMDGFGCSAREAEALTSPCEHAGNAVDEARLIRYKDGDDMLLLSLRQRLGIMHVHVVLLPFLGHLSL